MNNQNLIANLNINFLTKNEFLTIEMMIKI
jgi:hypothetical protein